MEKIKESCSGAANKGALCLRGKVLLRQMYFHQQKLQICKVRVINRSKCAGEATFTVVTFVVVLTNCAFRLDLRP